MPTQPFRSKAFFTCDRSLIADERLLVGEQRGHDRDADEIERREIAACHSAAITIDGGHVHDA